MKNVALLLATALALSCSESDRSASATADLAGVSPGQLRGVAAVSATLASRLFASASSPSAPDKPFLVANVAGVELAVASEALAGGYAPSAGGTSYSGTPNPINAAIWYAFASRVGEALGEVCSSADDLATFRHYSLLPFGVGDAVRSWPLRASVAATVRDTCAFSVDRAEVAGAFFDAVMGPGTSLAAERAAFVQAFAEDASTPEERVRTMTIALLLNPYFLLER